MTTKFMFIRNDKGHPIGCMAYRISNNTMEFEVSTHNPVDPFDRKLGRFVAEGRLNRHPKHIAVTPCNDLLREAMVYLMADPSVPERLKKAMGKKLSRDF